MVSLVQLWLPLVASAVAVFVASSLIHMVFKWHNADYLKLPNEDEVRAAVRTAAAPPGVYVLPHITDAKALQTPEVQQKFTEGPVGWLTLRPSGAPRMGGHLAQWLALNLAIAAIAAYLASRTVPAGASFLAVCRVVSAVTFLAYGAGSVSDGIWWGRPWRGVAKDLLDAAIYATVAAVTFAWLWPH
jgi:hypothetical protein